MRTFADPVGQKATGSDSDASACHRSDIGNGCDRSNYQNLVARLGDTFALR